MKFYALRMAKGGTKAGMMGGAAALLLFALSLDAKAQTAPTNPPGWTFGLSFNTSWTSNPIESNRRVKGDGAAGLEASLARRFALWQGASLALTGQVGNEVYIRERDESYHRGLISVSFSQEWAGFFLSLSAAQRKTMNRDFSAHDSASRELGLGIGRNIALGEGWSLNVFGRIARRFLDDGAEDQFRAGINATLTHRRGPWIVRLGGGYGYVIEDKTPILPRINDRTVSARFGLAYEWAADSEVGVRFAFSRTYSSYAFDRYKAYSISPQISTSWRF